MSALSLDRPATGAESPVEKAGYYRRWGHYGYGPYYYRPYYRPYYGIGLIMAGTAGTADPIAGVISERAA